MIGLFTFKVILNNRNYKKIIINISEKYINKIFKNTFF